MDPELFDACERGDLEEVKRQLPTNQYRRADGISIALQFGHEHIAEHLLQSALPVDIGNLFKAGCRGNRLHVARYLFRTRREQCDLSLGLFDAVIFTQYDAARWLCENGAPVPFISRIANGLPNRDMCMLLFEYGAPVQERMGDDTPLTHDEFAHLWHLKENRVRPAIDFSHAKHYLGRLKKWRKSGRRKVLLHTTLAEDCISLVFKYV